jgi:hypothetical protein
MAARLFLPPPLWPCSATLPAPPPVTSPVTSPVPPVRPTRFLSRAQPTQLCVLDASEDVILTGVDPGEGVRVRLMDAVLNPVTHVALVVGNNAYAHPDFLPLQQCVNDAVDVAAYLAGCGYIVVRLLDGSLAGLGSALAELGRWLGKAASGIVVVVYFSGHGLQAGDTNFLVPVDVAPGLPVSTWRGQGWVACVGGGAEGGEVITHVPD